MNILRNICNSLIYKELPPPISSCSLRRIPLLLCLSFLLLPLGFMGCEKELIEPMQALYDESCGLENTSIDSVSRFRTKFADYVSKHFDYATHSEYYAPTAENINKAALHFYVKSGGWGDAITIGFGFGEGDADSTKTNIPPAINSDGLIQVGDVFIDTSWAGDTTIYFN